MTNEHAEDAAAAADEPTDATEQDTNPAAGGLFAQGAGLFDAKVSTTREHLRKPFARREPRPPRARPAALDTDAEDTDAEQAAPAGPGLSPAALGSLAAASAAAAAEWNVPDYDALAAAAEAEDDDDPDDQGTAAAAKPAEKSAAAAEPAARSVVLMRRRSIGLGVGGGGAGRAVLVTTTVVGVLGAAAAGLIWWGVHHPPVLPGMGHHADAAPAGPPPPWATADCAARTEGHTVIGATPGDTSSAIGAIRAFDYAYYVQRNGAAARALAAQDASVPDAAAIQHGIDAIPAGTRYCVAITPGLIGGYEVTLSEQWPGDAAPQKISQTVTVTTSDGRAVIVAITDH